MDTGTGTNIFAKEHPARFFDVGIAEGHAVTFAAGLATQGVRPFCAIYSTFLQRAYDNIIHDVAIQRLPVVFAMDRAGVVGDDGPTHMGLYDIAYMLAIPGMTVAAPRNGAELIGLMRTALAHTAGPFCFRYPRDVTPDQVPATHEVSAIDYGSWDILRRGDELAILAVGTMVEPSLAAALAMAAEGVNVTVVNCRFLKPYDATTLASLLVDHRRFVVVEEGTSINGFGSYMASVIGELDAGALVIPHGVPDRFVEQAPRARQLAAVGLDVAGITRRVRAALESEALAG
jgi:1-deoxy-D-xylulose-5-phosphate synthase